MISRNIDTDRLTLRLHTPCDLDDCTAMWADPDVVRLLSGKPSTREETWSRLLRYAGNWALMDFGYWVVREKASNRFVGEVGLSEFRREIVPSFEGSAESGWALAFDAQGKGYATEAVRAALAWYAATFGPLRTVCIINPENAASIRVAEKCGYRERILTQYRGNPVLLFERLSP